MPGGLTLKLKAEGFDDVRRRVAAAIVATDKPDRLMKSIAGTLESSTRRRFRTNKAPDGAPWKPSIRAALNGGRTLFDKGHLSNSITSASDDHTAMVGTNLIYALIHQVGGVISAKGGGMLKFSLPGGGFAQVAKVTIPARPYIGVSIEDRVNIGDLAEKYIAQAFS